mmetsp:Transcript_30711/g.60461  ORF Transcript_30711/g.60461 Transcript_30711/m.60461 type:complete len:148 (+) Transcript_30711:261-704(+)
MRKGVERERSSWNENSRMDHPFFLPDILHRPTAFAESASTRPLWSSEFLSCLAERRPVKEPTWGPGKQDKTDRHAGTQPAAEGGHADSLGIEKPSVLQTLLTFDPHLSCGSAHCSAKHHKRAANKALALRLAFLFRLSVFLPLPPPV